MREENKEGIAYYTRIYSFPILTTIWYFLYTIFEMPIFMYAGAFTFFLPVFSYSITDLMLMVMFYIPNLQMYKALSDGKSIMSYFILAIFILLLLNKKNKKKSNSSPKLLFAILIFSMNCLLTIFLTNSFSLVTSLLRYIIVIILFTYIVSIEQNKYNLYNKMKISLVFGSLITIITAYIFKITSKIDIYSIPFSGVRNDRNYYSATIAIVTSILLADMFISKKPKIFNMVLATFFSIAGAMSLSRTFIIASGINVLLVLIILFKKSKIDRKRKMIIFISLILTICLFYDTITYLYVAISQRFNSNDAIGGNGRFDAWKFYIEKTFSNVKSMLFGLGDPYNLINKGLINIVPHSVFIDIISAFGLVGTASSFLLYLEVYKQIGRDINFKTHIISILPLFTVIVEFACLSALLSINFILTTMFMFLYIRVYGEQLFSNSHLAK